MRWSRLIHGIAGVLAIAGALALVGAWAAENGAFLGFSQQHLYNDATGLLLLSIAVGIGARFHQKEES